jgi:KaiC/GvpD/RAD55 family RecA-like ATPase
MMLPKLPPNSAAIIVGPPLSGKNQVLTQLMLENLKQKQPVIHLSTDKSTEDVKKDLLQNRIYYGPYKNILRFIDCYSMQMGSNLQDTDDTKRVPGPLALNEISIAISQIETEFYKINPKHFIIFDSLSTLLMYSNAQLIGRFLQVLIAKIRNAGGTIIFTLEEGMHDPKEIVTIEHLMQAIIHIKHEKGKVLIKADGIPEFEDWKMLK